MKFIRLALLSLSAASFLAVPSLGSGIRKAGDDWDDIDEDLETGRMLQEVSAEHASSTTTTISAIDVARERSGCDCTTRDSEDLLDAQNQAMLSLGLTYALAAQETPTPGTPPDPVFKDLEKDVRECINLGIDILALMHCGGCAEGNAPHIIRNNGSRFIGGIKTYDCCCDSDSVKDIIKDELTAIIAAAPILTQANGNTIFKFMVKGYKDSSMRAIRGVVEKIYLTTGELDTIEDGLIPTEVNDEMTNGNEGLP